MEVVTLRKIGLGQAEQLHNLSGDSSLYSTVQLPGASLAPVNIVFTLLEEFEKHKNTETQTLQRQCL